VLFNDPTGLASDGGCQDCQRGMAPAPPAPPKKKKSGQSSDHAAFSGMAGVVVGSSASGKDSQAYTNPPGAIALMGKTIKQPIISAPSPVKTPSLGGSNLFGNVLRFGLTISFVAAPSSLGTDDVLGPEWWDQEARLDRGGRYIDSKIRVQLPNEPLATLYKIETLVAGWYNCYTCQHYIGSNNPFVRVLPSGIVQMHMEANEVWKYGITTESIPINRYVKDPDSYVIDNINSRSFVLIPMETNLLSIIKAREKFYIINYPYHVENIRRSANKGVYLPKPPGHALRIDK
jgi:hypothetical protein